MKDIFVLDLMFFCWVAPGQPPRLVLAQLPDQRKGLESATEITGLIMEGGSLPVRKEVLEPHSSVCSRQICGQTMVAVFAPRGGGGEITSYKGIDLRWAH